jgi:hypothetical protein
MSVVYVTNQDPRIDYKALESYGTVTYLTRGLSFSVAGIMDEVIRQLVNSTEADTLVVTGSTLESAIALMVWSRFHKQVRLATTRGLHWHFDTINLESISIEIEKARDYLPRR